MTRKIAFLFVLGALATPAYAQQPAPAPTKADVQKIVQTISADPAKLAAYCKIVAIEEQMAKASEAKDTAKLDQLGKQEEELQKTLGPDFVKLSTGLDNVDPKVAEELLAAFEPLDKQCEKK